MFDNSLKDIITNLQIAIVVHCYNRLYYLRQTINSITQHITVPYVLLVIDDYSNDKFTIPYLQDLKQAGTIHQLILKDSHLGRQHSFAMKRYFGYLSRAPYVLFLDSDATLQPEWAEKSIKAYETLKKCHKDRKTGIMTIFNRGEKTHIDKIFEYEGLRFGTSRWVGGLGWFMEREVLKNGGWDELKPTNPFPKIWTSPWIDDGSWRSRLTEKFGYEHTFVYFHYPSLCDHIGETGIHHQGGRSLVRGAQKPGDNF